MSDYASGEMFAGEEAEFMAGEERCTSNFKSEGKVDEGE